MIVAVLFGRGIMAIRQIVTVPVLLSAWGVEYYGSWMILSAIPTFLAMSNLGIGTSGNLKISHHLASNRLVEARRVFLTSQILIGIIGITVTAISFGMASIYESTTSSLLGQPALILGALLLTAFLQMSAVSAIGWWTGNGAPSKGYHHLNIGSLVAFIISIAVPMSGGDAKLLSLSLLAWQLIWLGSFFLITSKAFGPLVDKHNSRFDADTAFSLIKSGSGHQLGALSQALVFQGSIVLAGHLFGSNGAALWSALRIVTRSGNQLLEIVSASLSPEFQVAYASNQISKLRTLHIGGLLASFSIATIAVPSLLLFGETAFNIWTSNVFQVSSTAFWIMSLSIIPASLWINSAEVQRAANQPWRINTHFLLAAAASLLIILQLQQYKMVAMAAGAMVFDLLVAALIMPTTLRLLNSTPRSFLLDIAVFAKNKLGRNA